MNPIQIDLRNLTQNHLDACLPHLGACSYAAPCIIGTLIPEDQREHMDLARDPKAGAFLTIDELVKQGLIQFPDAIQERAARRLQEAFDESNADELLSLASYYI